MNMEFDIECYKNKLRKMTAVFDRYCRDNNLRYSLCAGSLLGAIRHHGIIPWDDDVDVMMPRPDYNRLLEFAKTNFPDGYKIICADNTSHYYLPIAKMTDLNTCMIEFRQNMECQVGVNMDIFPVDVIPEDEEHRENIYHQFLMLSHKASDVAEYAHFKSPFEKEGFRMRTLLHWIKNKIYRLFYNSAALFKKANVLISTEDWENGKHCRIYTSYQYHNRIFDKTLFETYIELDFDGIKVMCISEHETYLTLLFNNFMQLPPKEKQVYHHHHYFLNLDRGYTNQELRDMGVIKYW